MTYKSSTKVSKTYHIHNQPLEVFCQKVLLELSQYLQENTCARVSFLIKVRPWPGTLLKKRLWHRCFPVNLAKFLRTPFSQITSGACFCIYERFFGLQTEFLKMSKEEFLISKYLIEIFRRSSWNTSRCIKTSF